LDNKLIEIAISDVSQGNVCINPKGCAYGSFVQRITNEAQLQNCSNFSHENTRNTPHKIVNKNIFHVLINNLNLI